MDTERDARNWSASGLSHFSGYVREPVGKRFGAESRKVRTIFYGNTRNGKDYQLWFGRRKSKDGYTGE